MTTGFNANQLYSACSLTLTHHFPFDGTEGKPIDGTGFLVEFPTGDSRLGLVTNRHLAEPEFYDPEDTGQRLKLLTLQWWKDKDT